MATERMASNISSAMLNQSDPEIVRTGAPAYLLLIDSLIVDDPANKNLLLAGSRLYGAYAGGLVDNAERRKRLTGQAMDYAARAFCMDYPEICSTRTQTYEVFEQAVSAMNMADLPGIYVYATSWAGWIAARQGDWNAIADLPRAELLLQRLADLHPAYEQGRVQLYLGVMRTLLPASAGGKPEQGKQHFIQALEYSGGRDLVVKVEYAKRYARLVFDRHLHDRLLQEVLQADPVHSGLTLSNVLAQQEAEILLNDDYF